MELNMTMAVGISTAKSPLIDAVPRWQNVREYSFPLAVFGAVFTSALPVLTTGGTILLLIVIVKFPQLRQAPSNLLLASLAVSDLLTGLLVQPLYAAAGLSCLFTDNCSAIPSTFLIYVGSFLGYSSCLNIALITIDRYICIVESLRYITIVTETRAIKAVIIIWVISAVLPVMRLVRFFPITVIRIFHIIFLSLILFVIFFCYGRMYRISQRHKRQIISQLQAVTQGPIEQEFQSAKTVFLVVGSVLVCYTPMLAIQFLFTFTIFTNHVKMLQFFAVIFFFVSSSVNPLIIFYRSKKLRNFLKKLFKRDA